MVFPKFCATFAETELLCMEIFMERIMKTVSIVHIIAFALLAAFTSCNTTHSSIWEEMPVVAHVETLDGEPLTVCHLDQLKDTVHIPLSELVEDLHIVKLDNREEAMVNIADISLSENYILVAGFRSPCKLLPQRRYLCRKDWRIWKRCRRIQICIRCPDRRKERTYLSATLVWSWHFGIPFRRDI